VFKARLDFTRPRPQAVYSLTHLITQTLIEYARFLGHPAVEPVLGRLDNLDHRNQVASDLHERFLVESRR
jgi:hypothetical protein